jgi:4-hydroxybenzoate polyprenyltransferase
MPPLFGMIANAIDVSLLPVFLFVLLALMVVMHEMLNRVTAKHGDG